MKLEVLLFRVFKSLHGKSVPKLTGTVQHQGYLADQVLIKITGELLVEAPVGGDRHVVKKVAQVHRMASVATGVCVAERHRKMVSKSPPYFRRWVRHQWLLWVFGKKV